MTKKLPKYPRILAIAISTRGFGFALVQGLNTRNGTFAGFSYPSNQLTMQLSNSPTSVIARVTGLVTNVPQPMLLLPEIVGSDVRLTWTAVWNTTYRLEFKPDLIATNWNALPGDVIGVTNTATKLDMLTPSNRFYRVRANPSGEP